MKVPATRVLLRMVIGNSKYHYYGIRLKPTSSLHGVPDDPSDSPRSNHGQNGQKKSRGASSPGSRSNHDSLMHENHSNSSSESPQVAAVNALSQTLRPYTSLNHLAQAARAVLHNESQINQMLSDLNRVDFHNIQEQASWVTLEQWASWLDGVVNRVLENHVGKPDFQKAARQFILHWSFYSSMVITDLTLRSAASFGSFHLIRLLFDEYMYFLVEHKVAHERNETTVAIMGKSSSCFTPYDYSSPDKSTGPPPSKRERIN
ncbi:hypothetical protein QYM36_018580 [Artemia franciscana]|uniref:RFX1-4/6/8-like BCD domain-containing protein n=1 Tax=Artemia franciscana TaxID=6661 RepID=A0AA88H3S3_ARTSF|nr:hypothetical protein QYM36_018580 [Artemia franciscana]